MKRITFLIVLLSFINIVTNIKANSSKKNPTLIDKISLEVVGRNYFIKTSILIKSKNGNFIRIPLLLKGYKHRNKDTENSCYEYKKLYSTTISNYFMFRGCQKLSAELSTGINNSDIVGFEIIIHQGEKRTNQPFFIYFDNLLGYNKNNEPQTICALDDINNIIISTEPKSAEKFFSKYNQKNGKIVIRNKDKEEKCLGIKLFDIMKVDKIIFMLKK